jgi:hypothetical protein
MTSERINERRSKRRNKAVARMNAALVEVYEDLGNRWAKTDRATALNRYSMGQAVNTVTRDKKTYGAHAVELLSAALGHGDDSLYDMAKVASIWAKADFEAILERPTVHRRPLSFSHFVALSRVPTAAKRREFIEAALESGLSVRELTRRIDAQAAVAHETDWREELDKYERAGQALLGRAEALRTEIAVILRRGGRLSAKDRDRLIAARDRQRAIEAAVISNRQAFEALVRDAIGAEEGDRTPGTFRKSPEPPDDVNPS